MNPFFDPAFIFDSYSCRLGKGTHKAVNRLQKFAGKVSKNNTKDCFILKCDIKKFFDSVGHDILISLIQKKIQDKNAIWLIEEIIKSFSTQLNKDLPLGNITSQLFANIYLNELDRFIKHKLRIKYYIRCCGDFVIINKDRGYLEKIIPQVSLFLNKKLKLSLHYDKVIIRKYHRGLDFLGYISFPQYRILRTKTKKRMFKRIKQRIEELREEKITKESFNQTIQSYLGTLKHCKSFKVLEELKSQFNLNNL